MKKKKVKNKLVVGKSISVGKIIAGTNWCSNILLLLLKKNLIMLTYLLQIQNNNETSL